MGGGGRWGLGVGVGTLVVCVVGGRVNMERATGLGHLRAVGSRGMDSWGKGSRIVGNWGEWNLWMLCKAVAVG